MRQTRHNPLLELLQSQEEEVAKYKWIESERLGYDIGEDRAREEWNEKHFGSWRRYCWEKQIAQALGESN